MACPEHRHYRSLFVSDLHLGSAGCRAGEFLEFLKHTDSDYLYLVGDIVDGWRLRKRWYWPQAHNDIIQKILRKARKGTKVFYIPGNHDEAARQYVGFSFGEIEIFDDMIHETADGRRLLVIHGDQFDQVMHYAPWLANLGDTTYTLLLVFNRFLNTIRRLFNLPYWSLSQYLKLKVKRAVSFISAFETMMVREARRRGCDGVVCGHIHKAELSRMEEILYANDGDWVESLTALAEHHDGRLEILDCQHYSNLQPAAAGSRTTARKSA